MAVDLARVWSRWRARPDRPSASGGEAAVSPAIPLDVAGAERTRSIARELRRVTIGGVVVVGVFVVGGVGWSATAPISSAVVAMGKVGPSGSRQTVQHFEGGIIREIKVAEGDKVKAGDTLVVLRDVAPRADVGRLESRLRSLAATEARLRAQRDGADHVVFTHPSLAQLSDPEVAQLIRQQIRQFENGRASQQSRIAILNQRIAQLEQQINGYQRQFDSAKQQADLTDEEMKDVKTLLDRGLERKPRMLALQRSRAELVGQQGSLQADLARAKETIGETKLSIIQAQNEYVEKTEQKLADTYAERVEVENELGKLKDRLQRTHILAPEAGTVFDLRVTTEGGVIQAGEPILDLVPDTQNFVIDAKVRPSDIDQMHAGQTAYVTFPAYPQRNIARIPAIVDWVSADVYEEKHTGSMYYTAKVSVQKSTLEELAPQIKLVAGMPAQVFVSTGNRTLLEYMIQPFEMTLEKAFREQ